MTDTTKTPDELLADITEEARTLADNLLDAARAEDYERLRSVACAAVDMLTNLGARLASLEVEGRPAHMTGAALTHVENLASLAGIPFVRNSLPTDPIAEARIDKAFAERYAEEVKRSHLGSYQEMTRKHSMAAWRARNEAIEARLRTMKPGERLAVCEADGSIECVFLSEGQSPELGKEWTVYGPAPQTTPPALKVGDRVRIARKVEHPAWAWSDEMDATIGLVGTVSQIRDWHPGPPAYQVKGSGALGWCYAAEALDLLPPVYVCPGSAYCENAKCQTCEGWDE